MYVFFFFLLLTISSISLASRFGDLRWTFAPNSSMHHGWRSIGINFVTFPRCGVRRRPLGRSITENQKHILCMHLKQLVHRMSIVRSKETFKQRYYVFRLRHLRHEEKFQSLEAHILLPPSHFWININFHKNRMQSMHHWHHLSSRFTTHTHKGADTHTRNSHTQKSGEYAS